VNGGWPPLLCFYNGGQSRARARLKPGVQGVTPCPAWSAEKKSTFTVLEISEIFFIIFKLKNFKALLGVSIRGLKLQSWLSC
jgi:hypothetical protein